jgi:hypothetical protein
VRRGEHGMILATFQCFRLIVSPSARGRMVIYVLAENTHLWLCTNYVAQRTEMDCSPISANLFLTPWLHADSKVASPTKAVLSASKVAEMTVIAPVNLHFEDSGNWYSLPEWAEFFINVGKQIASADRSESRIVTAIVVPTRAFGAAFVSLGMVVSDAAARDRSSESVHFEKLFDLPVNTPVIFRPRPGKTLRGVLREPEECEGKLYIRVKVHSSAGGGLTYLVDESKAMQVQPAGHNGRLPMTQQGTNLRFANEFVESLVGEADPVQLGLRSKLVCALVGKRNTLEHEIRQTPLAIHVNGNRHSEGHLQDILRINRFVSGQQSHRSALVPVGSGSPSDNIVDNVEMGVVFDGAIGFLRWGQMWRGRHHVVILDRTEPYFEDAISAINARFSQDRADGNVDLPGNDAPPGGEILTFREVLQWVLYQSEARLRYIAMPPAAKSFATQLTIRHSPNSPVRFARWCGHWGRMPQPSIGGTHWDLSVGWRFRFALRRCHSLTLLQ